MKKKFLFVVVALLASAYFVFNGDLKDRWIDLKDRLIDQFDANFAKMIKPVNESVDNCEQQVFHAITNHMKCEIWLAEARRNSDALDQKKSVIVKEIAFLRDRMAANEPVRFKSGKELTEDELEVEIARRDAVLTSINEMIAFYNNDTSDIQKEMEQYRDWAVFGPSRLEALKLARRRLTEKYEFQRKRLVSIDWYNSRSLKEAFDDAMAKINETKASLGLSDTIPIPEIDFGEQQAKNAETKHRERLAKLNAMLGDDKPSDDENVVAFE